MVVCEPQGVSAQWKETAQTRVFVFSLTLFLNHVKSQPSMSQTFTTHNTNRHCTLLHFPGTIFVETAVYIGRSSGLFPPGSLLLARALFQI